jgi:hypothetical protein
METSNSSGMKKLQIQKNALQARVHILKSYNLQFILNITTLICEVLTATTIKIFGHDNGGSRFLETIMLTYQHTCHHIPNDSITFIRITSQTFKEKGKCMWQLDYPTIKS